MLVPRLQLCQHLVARADHRLQQQPGHDRQTIAHLLRTPQVDLRRLAAAHHVQQARPPHQLRHRRKLFHRLRRLDERHVGPRRQRLVRPPHRLVEARHRARIGAGDDHEFALLRRHGSTDLRHVILARHNLLVVQMAALLRRHLILDMDRRHAAPLIFLHGPEHVQLVAIAGVRIGDHRHRHRPDDTRGILHHLAHRQQAEIRIAARDGCPRARHVDGGKSRLLDELRGQPVIRPGRDHHILAPQQHAQSSGTGHRPSSLPQPGGNARGAPPVQSRPHASRQDLAGMAVASRHHSATLYRKQQTHREKIPCP